MIKLLLLFVLVFSLSAEAQAQNQVATTPTIDSAANAKFFRMQALVAENSPSQPETTKEPVHPGILILEVGIGLLAVLGLAVGSIRLLKKAQKGIQGSVQGGGNLMEIVEILHLGPGQKVVALKIHQQIVVVGATKESIGSVHVLPEPASSVLADRNTNPQVFSDNLNRLLDKFKKPKKVSEFEQEVKA